MAMKATVLEGDRPGSDEGGALAVTGVEGGGVLGGGSACVSQRRRRRGRADGGGRRKGGAHALVREREWDGLGGAGREAKA
jgi:hypothetical protein